MGMDTRGAKKGGEEFKDKFASSLAQAAYHKAGSTSMGGRRKCGKGKHDDSVAITTRTEEKVQCFDR